MDSAEPNNATRGRGRNKRTWTAEEDRIFIEVMQEVAADTTYKNGPIWKDGYLRRVEVLMAAKLPEAGLKAHPHIDSRWKLLKRKYNAINEMLGKSGFGWDETTNKVICEKSVYEDWCIHHKEARGLWNVSFPNFHQIGELVGNDRATGAHVETFNEAVDAIENEVAPSADDEIEDNEDATGSASSSRQKRQRTRRNARSDGMSSQMERMTDTFGGLMERMTTHLGNLSSSFYAAEQRENKMKDDLIHVLLNIPGLTQVQVFNAANILSSDMGKLPVFYQVPNELKKMYVLNLLGESSI